MGSMGCAKGSSTIPRRVRVPARDAALRRREARWLFVACAGRARAQSCCRRPAPSTTWGVPRGVQPDVLRSGSCTQPGSWVLCKSGLKAIVDAERAHATVPVSLWSPDITAFRKRGRSTRGSSRWTSSSAPRLPARVSRESTQSPRLQARQPVKVQGMPKDNDLMAQSDKDFITRSRSRSSSLWTCSSRTTTHWSTARAAARTAARSAP